MSLCLSVLSLPKLLLFRQNFSNCKLRHLSLVTLNYQWHSCICADCYGPITGLLRKIIKLSQSTRFSVYTSLSTAGKARERREEISWLSIHRVNSFLHHVYFFMSRGHSSNIALFVLILLLRHRDLKMASRHCLMTLYSFH